MNNHIDIAHIQTVVKRVIEERKKQEQKWGQQNHNPFMWNAILVEEVGEVSQAILEAYDWVNKKFSAGSKLDDLKEELIQVIAVGVAMYQSIERNEEASWSGSGELVETSLTGINRYYYDLDQYEDSFSCTNCEAEGEANFIYKATYANGEEWTCSHCGMSIMVSERPNEDNY